MAPHRPPKTYFCGIKSTENDTIISSNQFHSFPLPGISVAYFSPKSMFLLFRVQITAVNRVTSPSSRTAANANALKLESFRIEISDQIFTIVNAHVCAFHICVYYCVCTKKATILDLYLEKVWSLISIMKLANSSPFALAAMREVWNAINSGDLDPKKKTFRRKYRMVMPAKLLQWK